MKCRIRTGFMMKDSKDKPLEVKQSLFKRKDGLVFIGRQDKPFLEKPVLINSQGAENTPNIPVTTPLSSSEKNDEANSKEEEPTNE